MAETLSENEMASLRKIAELRGQLGRMRRNVREAYRMLLSFEHTYPNPSYPTAVLDLLREALEEKP